MTELYCAPFAIMTTDCGLIAVGVRAAPIADVYFASATTLAATVFYDYIITCAHLINWNNSVCSNAIITYLLPRN